MKSAQRPMVFFLLCVLLFAAWSAAGEANEPGEGLRSAKAAVIICHDMIDEGLLESIKRRSGIALAQDVDYLIYDIDTFGGGLFAAYEISDYLLHEINAKASTVAYVSKKAISAGALISVACEDIIMKEKTRIGDCAPIMLGGKLEGVEREKIETDTRTAFETSAEHNGYPAALLKAMVTQEIEVYRVKNTGSGKYEFFEGDRLPRDANGYDLANKELIDSGDELLTLTASQAVEYGVARAQVKDLQGVLDFLAKRDGVTFVGEPMVLKTNWSEEMVRWVNSPVVMGVLVVIALLGVYIELSSPGVGLPGLVAVICFVIIVGSRYLTGLANWIEVVVLVVGMVLLAIEIFVLPGFGIAGILGIMCILAGLFGMLVHNAPNEVPWPRSELDWRLFTNGVIGLSGGFLGFLILAWVFAKYLPRIPVASRMILAGPEESAAVRLGGAPAPGSVPEVTVGQQGVSVTQLRPSGIGRFGSERLSVVSQGELIEANREIIVAQMDGNSIVVKEVRGSNNKA